VEQPFLDSPAGPPEFFPVFPPAAAGARGGAGFIATAAITWGLTISEGAQKRWGYACGGLFALTFACGMIALIASTNSKLAEPHPAAVQVRGT